MILSAVSTFEKNRTVNKKLTERVIKLHFFKNTIFLQMNFFSQIFMLLPS